MTEFGYALSAEEHRPNDLVRYAQRAEEAGFTFALISDHYHPWIDRQGQAPFVWNVIGAIAHATERLQLGTGVTCPTMRIHPAVLAQAAATAADMMPGRFFLGVGTGENLNEHILGERWPGVRERQEMLEEAISILRQLWQGGYQSHAGEYFQVDRARIYTLPDQLPPIMVAASGPQSAELAGRLGDGLISTAPDPEVVETFQGAGGSGKPRYGQLTVCWAEDEARARKTAFEYWPNAAITGQLSQELALPLYFEQTAQLLTEDQVAQSLVLGPDSEQHAQALRSFEQAGFTHVYVHQAGPDQEGFFSFYERDVLPRVQRG